MVVCVSLETETIYSPPAYPLLLLSMSSSTLFFVVCLHLFSSLALQRNRTKSR